jgi:hypothetical protein
VTEQEKDMLRRIPSLRIEAQSMLRLVSHLQNSGKEGFDKEIDKWLDRLHYLNMLEKELKEKNNE